jgi:hypothetical protein
MGMDTENENIENIAESEEAVEAAENAEAASEQAGGEQQDEVKKIAEERDEFLKLAAEDSGGLRQLPQAHEKRAGGKLLARGARHCEVRAARYGQP